MELKGRVALVTGAAVRVGRTIALTLAARGARIVINYRASGVEADRTAAEIRALGSEAAVIRADVTVAADVQRLLLEATAAFGGVDVLVNNAAIYPRTPFDTLTEHDWDNAIDTNLKGPFLCAWQIGAQMKQRGAGKIVSIADWAGVRPYRDYLPYCVSKAGVIALTKALALELAPEGCVTGRAAAQSPPSASENGAFCCPQEAANPANPAYRRNRGGNAVRSEVFLPCADPPPVRL